MTMDDRQPENDGDNFVYNHMAKLMIQSNIVFLPKSVKRSWIME